MEKKKNEKKSELKTVKADGKVERTEIDKDSSKIIGRCFEIIEKEQAKVVAQKTKDGLVVHYYIEVLEDKSMALEMVGKNSEPTGILIENISTEDFAKKFKTCSQHECSMHKKTVDEIGKKMAENRVTMGEKHLKDGELEKAEGKFKRALTFDEASVRASLGLGKTKMAQDKIEEAMKIFKKLSADNAIYDTSNKHTLNDFGIYLRRKGLFSLAIENYEKAISTDPTDEALYFNLGIAYKASSTSAEGTDKELAFIQKAISILKEALELNADFSEAKEYLEKFFKTEKKMLTRLLGAGKGKPKTKSV